MNSDLMNRIKAEDFCLIYKVFFSSFFIPQTHPTSFQRFKEIS